MSIIADTMSEARPDLNREAFLPSERNIASRNIRLSESKCGVAVSNIRSAAFSIEKPVAFDDAPTVAAPKTKAKPTRGATRRRAARAAVARSQRAARRPFHMRAWVHLALMTVLVGGVGYVVIYAPPISGKAAARRVAVASALPAIPTIEVLVAQTPEPLMSITSETAPETDGMTEAESVAAAAHEIVLEARKISESLAMLGATVYFPPTQVVDLGPVVLKDEGDWAVSPPRPAPRSRRQPSRSVARRVRPPAPPTPDEADEVLYESAAPDEFLPDGEWRASDPVSITHEGAPRSARRAQAEFELEGIFYDPNRPMAIVNGEVVEVGHRIGRARVLEIKPTRVKITVGDTIKILTL